VPEFLRIALRDLSLQLGVTRAVSLFQSTLVESPLVIGVLKPVILFPAALLLQLPPDQLESLLAHELAHVRRHDYFVNLLQTVIETLLFYHPGVWWISSRIRQEREHCCDELVVRYLMNRTAYVQALAAVARARIPLGSPAATGGILLPRLQRILGVRNSQPIHPTRWISGLFLLSMFVLMLVFSTGIPTFAVADGENKSTPKTGSQSETSKPLLIDGKPVAVTKGTMLIKIVDEDGLPIPSSEVHASIWTDEKNFKANRNYTSDQTGLAVIELPKTLRILRVWARKRDRVPLFAQWWPEEQSDGHLIPDEFTFKLVPGTRIGGIVKNADGLPIPGVKVQVRYDQVETPEIITQRPRVDTWLSEDADDTNKTNPPCVTDSEGRWTLNTVPPGDDVNVQLLLNHPDYVGDVRWGDLQEKQAVTMQALRKEVAQIIMPNGVTLTGRVTDPDGKPVQDAVVIWGDRPYWEEGSQEVKTDVDGKYRLPPLPTGSKRLTIVAKGWMPYSRKISIEKNQPSVDIQLQPGRTLRVKFVDDHGDPLSNVWVLIESWRDSEALYNHRHPNVVDTQIPVSTGDFSCYEWTWAPDDPVTFRAGREGSDGKTFTVTADGTEQVQVLP
ncbi:MAG: carboxypeptidase regulatory-like domain-containing protein, partial [Planctomycetaceae bacterium]|nr:carboxypeptidase regulatory-like domain-containing protein [Planctomycetaceae bacterium]